MVQSICDFVIVLFMFVCYTSNKNNVPVMKEGAWMKPINEARITRTFEFIRAYREKYERTPTVRVIMKECGYSSYSMVDTDIKRLKERGMLTADEDGKLLFNSDADRAKITPSMLVGTVHCGTPAEAQEEVEAYISLPTAVFGNDKNLVLLHAKGNSMIDKSIYDGDILVVRKQPNADVNDVIIACLCDGEATCKTLKKDDDGIFYLHPENPEYDDIVPCEGWSIYGIVKQVIHTL